MFLANSGAEAVEAGFKLARWYTGREKAVAFLGAFHGRTLGALSLTASKAVQREGFGPLVPGVTHIPYAYCYRCAYHLAYPDCDLQCVRYLEEVLFKSVLPPEEIAFLITEPIQGEGGYIVPPPEYHARLKALAEKYGFLYFVDEIQTGMGRTGRMFAIEHFGVEPDLLTLAKGIASGLPLSALIARDEIMSWDRGAHGSTFGGNPVACAGALATLEVVQAGLVAECRRAGTAARGGPAGSAAGVREHRGRARPGPHAGHGVGPRPGQQETRQAAAGPDFGGMLPQRAHAAELRGEHGPLLPAADRNRRPDRHGARNPAHHAAAEPRVKDPPEIRRLSLIPLYTRRRRY